MNTYRKNAIIAGALWIAATVVPILGMVVIQYIQYIDAPDYLVTVAANANQVKTGALFELVYAFASASIAIWLYPVLKKYDEALALGSVAFRLIEGILGIVAVIGLLSLLTLSQAYVKAGAPDASGFQAVGTSIFAARHWAGMLSGAAFILGATMYYYIFYRSKLIPRWLSVWGLIGVPFWIASILLRMFGVIESLSTSAILFDLLIMVNEMVLAVWLIVKGFNPSAIASLNAKTDTDAHANGGF